MPARRARRRQAPRPAAARPAPRRAGARRGGPRPLAAARAPGRGDRRLAADPWLPARRPSCARRLCSGSCTAQTTAPRGRSRQPGRQDPRRRRRLGGLALFDTADIRADRRATLGARLASTSLAYSPDGENTRGRRRRAALHLIDARTREVAGARPSPGGRRAWPSRRAGSSSSLESSDVDQPRRRDATLEQVGPAIALEGFRPRTSVVHPATAVRAHPRRPLGRHGLGRRRARLVGPRSRQKRRTMRIATGHHALALSPDGLHAARRDRPGHPARRPATARRGPLRARSPASPHWVLFSPDGETVVSTSLDGRVTLWDAASATPTRDAARALGRGQAARLQPRRRDALHRERRRNGDRLGPHGRRRPRRGRSRSRTTARSTLLRPPPGGVQPRRAADRGRPQGARHRAPGTRPISLRPARRSWIPVARSRHRVQPGRARRWRP